MALLAVARDPFSIHLDLLSLRQIAGDELRQHNRELVEIGDVQIPSAIDALNIGSIIADSVTCTGRGI